LDQLPPDEGIGLSSF